MSSLIDEPLSTSKRKGKKAGQDAPPKKKTKVSEDSAYALVDETMKTTKADLSWDCGQTAAATTAKVWKCLSILPLQSV